MAKLANILNKSIEKRKIMPNIKGDQYIGMLRRDFNRLCGSEMLTKYQRIVLKEFGYLIKYIGSEVEIRKVFR